MKMVPSAVICGVTSSWSTASTNCTETVLFTMVCTGILVPCFTVAFWLFCVITFGFEINLPTPRSSAAVMMASSAKLADWNAYVIPLVGVVAPKAVNSGRLPDGGTIEEVLPGVVTYSGGAVMWLIGLDPTADAPPTLVLFDPKPAPSSVP